MVDLTTAIIFLYVYFIPQKAKSFAITYFCVACYGINWFHNLRGILYTRYLLWKLCRVGTLNTSHLLESDTRVNSTCNTAKGGGAKTGQSVITVCGKL